MRATTSGSPQRRAKTGREVGSGVLNDGCLVGGSMDGWEGVTRDWTADIAKRLAAPVLAIR